MVAHRTFWIAGLAGLALAASALAWFRLEESGDPFRTLDIRIGRIRMAIPAGYIHDRAMRRSGEFNEIELAADARTFRPAPAYVKLTPGTENAQQRVILITLREQDAGLDPVDRLPRLYARFLVAGHWSHPGGLIVRRFEPKSPYQHEEIYLAPPEGRLFTARCMRPRQPHDGLPNNCIAQLRMAGLDVRLRFSPEHLANWENLMSGVRGLIQSQLR